MKRVLIIGGNGSGKTTMARQLAEITKLPLCHLDSLYWTGDWQVRERSEFLELLQAELEKSEWILDGNMRSTLPKRLPYCDTVIYLDFSGIRCFFGTVKRVLENHGRSRSDMGGNCVERFDKRSWDFIKSTLTFNRRNRAYFYDTIATCPHVELIVLKNRKAVAEYLKLLKLQYESKT